MKSHWSVLHAGLFYLVWFVVVTSVSYPHGELLGLLTQATFIALGLYMVREHLLPEARFFVALLVLGSSVDTIPVLLGFIEFSYTEILIWKYPLWMMGMWGCFASAFGSSLKWMQGRTFLQVLFGGIGGPLSLFAASRIGAVDFPKDLALTMGIYAVEWALLVPLAFRLYDASTRRPT